MSLALTCAWTLARTILLCLLAWPLMTRIERFLRSTSETRRSAYVLALLLPFLFPELLVGYALRSTAMVYPHAAEAICALFLLIRILPAGVVCLLISPVSRITPAAIHTEWLLVRANRGSVSRWCRLLACYWHGPVQRAVPALGLMGLIGFQEFELAALLQTASWTDWFITAQRTGLDQYSMTIQVLWPVLLQFIPFVGILAWLTRRDAAVVENEAGQESRADRFLTLTYLVLALLIGCGIPLFVIAQKLPSGLVVLFRQPSQLLGLLREVMIAGAIAVVASFIAWLISGSGFRRQGRGAGRFVASAFLIPGLAGSLLVSLLTVNVFQQTWLRAIYDTPIPWVVGLTVWLLPRAVMLRLWFATISRREGIHLAELLATPGTARSTSHQTTLLFRLRDEPQILGFGLLCYWAYLDLPTAYLLGPTGMQPGLVRLYNFMHFGRSAALSAESLVFFGMPIVLFFMGLQLRRFWLCWR